MVFFEKPNRIFRKDTVLLIAKIGTGRSGHYN